MYMELEDLNHYLRNKAISGSQSSSNLALQRMVDMAIKSTLLLVWIILLCVILYIMT